MIIQFKTLFQTLFWKIEKKYGNSKLLNSHLKRKFVGLKFGKISFSEGSEKYGDKFTTDDIIYIFLP